MYMWASKEHSWEESFIPQRVLGGIVTYLCFRFRLIMTVGMQSRNYITQEHFIDYNSPKGLGEAAGGLGGRLKGWWGLLEVRELKVWCGLGTVGPGSWWCRSLRRGCRVGRIWRGWDSGRLCFGSSGREMDRRVGNEIPELLVHKSSVCRRQVLCQLKMHPYWFK